MRIKLNESIHRLRKEAGLTQEQLAEALGVSVSAVHKWETGKSTPELGMLVDIAEFFETSVDVLLNYGWEIQSMGQAVEKLCRFCVDKEWDEGMRFAEKVLLKYPNSFEIVLRSAEVYFLTLKPEHMPRAVELYKKAMILSDQSEDAHRYVINIQNRIASCYSYMGRLDDAVGLLEKNNLNGMNNAQIGLLLSKEPEKVEKALKYLSDALVSCYSELYNICIGYAEAYRCQKKLETIESLILGLYELGNGLRDDKVIHWIDKGNVPLFILLAEIYLLRGDEQTAFIWMQKARKTAEKFDAAPNYHVGTGLKFYYGSKSETSFDDMGDTAMDIIEKLLAEKETQNLRPLWEAVLSEEEG